MSHHIYLPLKIFEEKNKTPILSWHLYAMWCNKAVCYMAYLQILLHSGNRHFDTCKTVKSCNWQLDNWTIDIVQCGTWYSILSHYWSYICLFLIIWIHLSNEWPVFRIHWNTFLPYLSFISILLNLPQAEIKLIAYPDCNKTIITFNRECSLLKDKGKCLLTYLCDYPKFSFNFQPAGHSWTCLSSQK
jgi:hypothetical protein